MQDEKLLLERTQAMCADPVFREIVWHHCPGLPPHVGADSLDLTIHPDDQMLLHSLKHHRDANAAFSQYFNVALQQYSAVLQVLNALFPGMTDRIQVLDFACGYGRLLRFLTLRLPIRNISAAEIQQDALTFVCENFNVHGIRSYRDPGAFEPNRRFDFIWVASLFSHLPEHLFAAWLRRLATCLEPDGVLCFSVHDACLLPPGSKLPQEGILFRPFSENPALEGSSYGTSYVSEAFVKRVITETCGEDHDTFRIPRCLAHEQDLYIVSARPSRDLSALNRFRRGPWGWVDERKLSESGELYLRGWAASLQDGQPTAVHIVVDGELHRCRTGRLREDVSHFFHDPRLAHTGWEFRCNPRPGSLPVKVSVTARTETGEKALLLAGEFRRP